MSGQNGLSDMTARATNLDVIMERRRQTTELLKSLGLSCPCGERMRADRVQYFWVDSERTPSTIPGLPATETLRPRVLTLHSTECPAAIEAAKTALAMRVDRTGEVVWLDEYRAAQQSLAEVPQVELVADTPPEEA